MIVEAVGGTVVAAGALYFLSKRLLGDRTPRKRAVSFSSQAMLSGAFPPKAEVWEPIINVIFYFKTAPSPAKLKMVGEKLMFYDRFRSVAKVLPNGTYSFEQVDSIDVEKDLTDTVHASSDSEMAEKVDKICSSDLDCRDTKPMWRFVRIENSNGMSGLLIRIHHSLGDGISLIGCIGKIFETEEGLPYSIDVPERAGGGVNQNASLPTWIKGFLNVATLPNTKHDSNICFTDQDKKNMVMGKMRRTVLFPTLKLAFLKALKNSAGVTINDVMLALTTGTIRRYCLQMNDPLLDSSSRIPMQNRVLMPVAFPRPISDTNSSSNAMRNLWSFVSAELPLTSTSPKERLELCAKETVALKASPMAAIQLWLQNNIVCHMPQFMQRQLAYDVFTRHSMVFSNLPGPAEHLNFCEVIASFRMS